MKKIIFFSLIVIMTFFTSKNVFADVLYSNDFESGIPLVSSEVICTTYAISPTHCDTMSSSISSVNTTTFDEQTENMSIDFYATIDNSNGFHNLRSSLDFNGGYNLIGFWGNNAEGGTWEIWDASQTYAIATGLTLGSMYHIVLNIDLGTDSFSLSTDAGETFSGSYSLTNPVTSATYLTFTRNGSLGFHIDDFNVNSDFFAIGTCSDGIQNQDETAIDFGGVCGEDSNLINGSTFAIKFIGQNGLIIPNGTNVQSLFTTTRFQIAGKNPFGVFDLISITILEDDSIISSKTYDVSPNSSTIINYVDTTLGELASASTDPFIYESGKKYTFNVVISSELISEVFNLSGFIFYNTEGICGLDIICYIKEGAEWLFIPTEQSINNFGNLTLANSFPFSYIFDMGNLYDEAFNHTAQSFNIAIAFGSFGDITLISSAKLQAVPFQGLVRTILGAILIFGTAMLLYGKIIGVHDQNHETGDSRAWHGMNPKDI